MTEFSWAHLREHAVERRQSGLRRSLHYRSAGSGGVDLSSNDYLSLVQDERLRVAAREAIDQWGTGATSSRLVTGSTQLHRELEQALCEHTGAEAAVVFSSGYLANLGAITALTDSDTLVVSDAYNHASLIDACRLSRAQIAVVPHRDLAAIETALSERRQSRAVVVTESIFSVDGDAADLIALQAISANDGAALLVDEAHSLGVVGTAGCGSVASAGISQCENVVVTATLSKALASQGGAILGKADVVDHVIDTSRSFIFDTALAPASVAAALAAIGVLDTEPERAARTRAVAQRLHTLAAEAGWVSPVPDAAVVSLLIGEPEVAVAEQQRWHDAGVHAGVFRPPSVPDGLSRLRLTAHAGLTESDFTLVRKLLESADDGLTPGRTTQ